MRFNSEDHKHLNQLETTIGRITGPVDKIHIKGQEQTVPGGDAVNHLIEAKRAVKSIETTLDTDTKTVEVESEDALQQLQEADAKLGEAQSELERLDKSNIAEHRMTNFKGAVFESFGRDMRVNLPEVFRRYENQSIIEIISGVRREIQRET
jgi:hypothetical protein